MISLAGGNTKVRVRAAVEEAPIPSTDWGRQGPPAWELHLARGCPTLQSGVFLRSHGRLLGNKETLSGIKQNKRETKRERSFITIPISIKAVTFHLSLFYTSGTNEVSLSYTLIIILYWYRNIYIMAKWPLQVSGQKKIRDGKSNEPIVPLTMTTFNVRLGAVFPEPDMLRQLKHSSFMHLSVIFICRFYERHALFFSFHLLNWFQSPLIHSFDEFIV